MQSAVTRRLLTLFLEESYPLYKAYLEIVLNHWGFKKIDLNIHCHFLLNSLKLSAQIKIYDVQCGFVRNWNNLCTFLPQMAFH
jgi:hypothetical protein